MDAADTPVKKSLASKDPKTQSIVKAFLIFKADRDASSEDGSIKTTCKLIWRSNHDGDEVLDEASIGLMCFPDGIHSFFEAKEEFKRDSSQDEDGLQFHSFLVTRENGDRFYGSCLLREKRDDKTRETSIQAYCLLTSIPFVVSTERLLRYFIQLEPDSSVIQRICRLRLPAKGKCLKLLLPPVPEVKPIQSKVIDTAYIFRGTSDFPLLDHPLRHLFLNVLNVNNFILALGAALLEFQVLVISKSYQEMMLVSESLTSLLLPFQWQHVYVPILPSKLGLHYLDAPTPYIMGINAPIFSTACSSFPSLTTHTSQVRIFCGENRIEFIPGSDLETDGSLDGISLSSLLPPFMTQLMEDVDVILKSNIKLVTQESRIKSKSLVLERVTQVARKHQVLDSSFDYVDDLKLNHVLRVLFTTTLEQNLLRDCEKFVLTSEAISGSKSSLVVKFDTVSFLTDQPDSLIPFFKKFLDTQMFASLIDARFRKNTSVKRTSFLDDKSSKLSMENIIQLKESVDKVFNGAFEDATIVDLNQSDISKSCLSPRGQRKVYKNLYPLNNNNKDKAMEATSVRSIVESTEKMLAAPDETSLVFMAQNNSRIIESLLRETRVKTKRILLEKMGREESVTLELTSSEEGVEGNALIASLCDLIERVWIHERVNDSYTGSYFWQSLSLYCRNQVQSSQDMSQVDRLTSALSHLSTSDQRGNYSLLSASRSTPSSPLKNRSLGHHRVMSHNLLEPLPESLTRDILSVQRMTDIKTDIGKSRAFIRLSLERKLLSQHLRTLLEQDELLSSYQKFAFLRSEEEREQFLTHLLTLNAVDLLCFTNSFVTSFLNYRIFVYGSGPFSGFFTVSGTLSDSGQIPLDIQGTSIVFTTKNLGLLRFLTLSCSFSSKVYVDFVVIRNEETGHAFNFPCHHWFGRNVEDDAVERILVAHDIQDFGKISDLIKKSQNKTSSIGRHFGRGGSVYDSRKDLPLEKLRLLLKQRVDDILRCCFKDTLDSGEDETLEIIMDSVGNTSGITQGNKNQATDSHRISDGSTRKRKDSNHGGLHYQELNHILFSEPDGFTSLLKECLYVGFKNRSKSPFFRKQVYLWDYVLRIQMELKLSWKTLDSHLSSVKNDPNVTPSRRKVASRLDRKFIEIVENINSVAVFWGKDSKMCLFLTIALRDKLLAPHFIRLLSWPSLAKQFFDPVSFVTDGSLTKYLIDVLSKTNEVDIVIDDAATKGI